MDTERFAGVGQKLAECIQLSVDGWRRLIRNFVHDSKLLLALIPHF